MSWSIREADIIATEITKDVKGEEDKMDLTRRAFVRNTTILAAAVAVGLPAAVKASKAIRAHGPVEIWARFLSKDPIIVGKCTLCSDERQDLFGVCIVDPDGKGTGIMETSLSGMRKAVLGGAGGQKMVGLCTTPEKKESLPLVVAAEQGKVSFTLGGWGPAWMKLEDVKRVL